MADLPPILLIDDNEDDLFLLQQLVRRSGAPNPVVALSDAVSAQAYLQQAGQCSASAQDPALPCVVFTDLKMPRLTGVELTAWIRAQQALAELPVYMVTSSDEPADLHAASRAGVSGYFQKYPTTRELSALLRTQSC